MPAPVRGELQSVAVYERSLPVSLERVWENVRDWEHLPWLHGGSFREIALVEEGAWGWRARIGLPRGDAILLELVIEPAAPRYVSRTLEGPGAGSEIWTDVTRRDDEHTDVRVEFFVPGLAPEHASAVGDAFVELYTRLWDEDESMMVERTRALAAVRSRGDASGVTPVPLGSLDALRPRLPLVVRFRGAGFRLVEHEGVLVAFSTQCPHRLGPLGDAPVEDGRVVCPWHGYAFEVATGRECSGRRMTLAQPPRVLVDPENGQVYLDAPERGAAG